MKNNNQLYPLKFNPLFKYRMWGGEKLKTHLNKNYKESNIGESWEISDVQNDETKVANGFLVGKTLKELALTYKEDFLGKHVYEAFGTDFPLLIKFIDAKTPLSIQVHPHDHIAKERHNSFGKNEMWYIMNADDDAEIIIGFNKELDKKSYEEHLQNDTVLEVMNSVTVKDGDVFYIPTGRVHAIGAGVVLAEIQQTSDITYRIYDYKRVDKVTGKERELHNDLALDVIDFKIEDEYKTMYSVVENESNKLIYTPYFKTNILNLTGKLEKNYTNLDSFKILIAVEGASIIIVDKKTYELKKGETILIPASVNQVTFKPNKKSKILEVFL